MDDKSSCINVLLIEDNSADIRIIEEALAGMEGGPFHLEYVNRLGEGIERLGKGGIGAVLLDMFLPDSQGMETFDKLFLAAPYVPILILVDSHPEAIAKEAVKAGAQDYLMKTRLDSYSLSRALRYVMERKKVEAALFNERERAQVTLNSIGDAVLSTDMAGNITYLNPVAEKMTGWSLDEAVNRPLADVFQIVDGVTRESVRNPMEFAIQQNKAVGLTSKNCILIRRDGVESAIEDSAAPIHDGEGRPVGAVMVFHDVSTARAMTLKMSHLAQHDFLTDLPNRVLFNDRLTQAIALARRHGEKLAVLFLDLDRFKYVNDSLGHVIGDKLLQSSAKRLVACVRGSDTVSRQGGDEFVVLLSEVKHAEDVAFSAEKIIAALVAPHGILEHDLHITVSIGISIFPNDGEDAETLIKSADTAMYHAKENGRNNYQFFAQAMTLRAIERQNLEGGLRRALERQEFILHYQPKINLETGVISGVEALIRWRHPSRGLLLPAHFIPIAEDCGLIVPIGQWVLREACRQAKAWLDRGLLPPMIMAVNISAVEFRNKNFLENVRAILADTRMKADHLELEITESVLMQDADAATALLQSLKRIGVRLAVDDFGTGYSSLSYLRQFPIDTLKIDQSFVHDIAADADDAAIVSAVISMARSRKNLVIAEGIETWQQLAFLQSQHCSEGQGYYFRRPMAAEEFAKLLATGVPEAVFN
jgi:diguanylate cyclase (GGDEF)-like protein/PAS domain S-box-containing protein